MMAAVQARCATATCDVRQTVTVSNTAWDKFQLREGLVHGDSPDRSDGRADTQATACHTRGRCNNAEEEMEGRE